MYDFIRAHQLNVMLLLCGASGAIFFLLFITRFLSQSRRQALLLIELTSFFLLWFDRLAYIYAGTPSHTGYIMVRLSNFMVFFLTSEIVLAFNRYLIDWLLHEGGMTSPPNGLRIAQSASIIGMILSVISAFTGLYYFFDANNQYHRGPGFLIAYIVPIVCPIIQFITVRKNREVFGRLIYMALVLYLFVPLGCGILQIFTYGLSLVNIAIVLFSIFLYFFTYIDINNTVEHAHKLEIEGFREEQKTMKSLFEHTAKACVIAVEKKDDYTQGQALRVAEYARRIAKLSGKDDTECDKIYYTALLHDVGLIGIPDYVIKNEKNPGKWDVEAMKQLPLIGREILSVITEYPFLSEGAYYSHERYNGTGYPEGLEGKGIPEMARIIAVADAYVSMTSKKRYREARPEFVAREELVKGAGAEFDPEFVDYMVKMIDEDSREEMRVGVSVVDQELECGEYRDHITNGIPVERDIVRITFDCIESGQLSDDFSAPSIILFDSWDRRVHDNQKAIEEYRYLEFGEIWFDDHSIVTAARNIREADHVSDDDTNGSGYEIIAGRYEDHLKLRMKSPNHTREIIVALPGGSKSAYIALTGEHCHLTDICIEQTGERVEEGDIPRIAKEISYIDHMESDIKNIQIDRTRSASTVGIAIKDKIKMEFHTMSLPGASFVWNCPYLVLFYSDDKCVNGGHYREYALIKLNGEYEGDGNRFSVKRKDDFPGWEAWKTANQQGMECEVSLEKKNGRVITTTENLGIHIENVTEIDENLGPVYVALTGDQCALTDIRIHQR